MRGFSLNWLRRSLAVTGLYRPSKDGLKPSGEEGPEEPDSSLVKETVSVNHGHFIPEGPTAIVTPQEFVFLRERLRGGKKGVDLNINSGNIFSPGTVAPWVGGPPNSLSLPPSTPEIVSHGSR